MLDETRLPPPFPHPLKPGLTCTRRRRLRVHTAVCAVLLFHECDGLKGVGGEAKKSKLERLSFLFGVALYQPCYDVIKEEEMNRSGIKSHFTHKGNPGLLFFFLLCVCKRSCVLFCTLLGGDLEPRRWALCALTSPRHPR